MPGVFSLLGKVQMAAIGGLMLKDAYESKREGKNVPLSVAKSAAVQGLPFLIAKGTVFGGMPAGLLLGAAPVLPALAVGFNGMVQARGTYLRQARTPFSHRFEHTEATMASMQRALQQISGANSMIGTEASSMAARYMRR